MNGERRGMVLGQLELLRALADLWDDAFCELLAAQGFWVVRFDNRDVGRSTILREAPIRSLS